MGNLAGTLKGISLDGTGFEVMADADPSIIGGETENDVIPTSGVGVIKKTKRIQKVESLGLKVSDEEVDALRALSKRETSFPMSYTTAGGAVFISQGIIEFETNNPFESKASITLLPVIPWERF